MTIYSLKLKQLCSLRCSKSCAPGDHQEEATWQSSASKIALSSTSSMKALCCLELTKKCRWPSGSLNSRRQRNLSIGISQLKSCSKSKIRGHLIQLDNYLTQSYSNWGRLWNSATTMQLLKRWKSSTFPRKKPNYVKSKCQKRSKSRKLGRELQLRWK